MNKGLPSKFQKCFQCLIEDNFPSVVLVCSPEYEAFFHQLLEWIVPNVPAKAKLAFINGFKRLQNHVKSSPEYCSRLLYLCIDLVEDADYNVRFKFRYRKKTFAFHICVHSEYHQPKN